MIITRKKLHDFVLNEEYLIQRRRIPFADNDNSNGFNLYKRVSGRVSYSATITDAQVYHGPRVMTITGRYGESEVDVERIRIPDSILLENIWRWAARMDFGNLHRLLEICWETGKNITEEAWLNLR